MPARHHDVSRLEGFSDAVFGFALTLLVVSLEVPRDIDALRNQVRGFIPFALMFAMVCWIWYEHNKFFRRYGLQDAWTSFLNCVLLFVVLFYVYPLKFLTTALIGPIVGLKGLEGLQLRTYGNEIMLLYSSGVVLTFGTFVLLYRHAWSRRHALGLSQEEELALRFGMRAHVLSMALGIASIAIVLTSKPLTWVAGFIYGLMGPLHAWNGVQHARAHKRLTATGKVTVNA